MKICNYYGIALTPYRKGTNCWGHKENESCIHLKFGHPFKYYSFTPEFENKHPEFVKIYNKAFDNLGNCAAAENKTEREVMLYIWRNIINLKEAGELVVIFNMCDLEADAYATALYPIQQDSANKWTWDELTKE